MEMLYGAIDIHKHVFQAAVFDPASGEVVEQRFPATRERLGDWAIEWQGRLTAVAIEATSGWRWVVRELQQQGFVVQLADPGQAVALKGKRRRAKTDRLDARWLAMLLAKQMLPSSATKAGPATAPDCSPPRAASGSRASRSTHTRKPKSSGCCV